MAALHGTRSSRTPSRVADHTTGRLQPLPAATTRSGSYDQSAVADASDASFTTTDPGSDADGSLSNGGDVCLSTRRSRSAGMQTISRERHRSYSLDGGHSWLQHEIVQHPPKRFSGRAGDTTAPVLVRVSDGGATEDVSDAVFTIYRPIVPRDQVITPNVGTIVWRDRDTVEIVWSSTAVDLVHIGTRGQWHYMVDIAQSVPSPDSPLNPISGSSPPSARIGSMPDARAHQPSGSDHSARHIRCAVRLPPSDKPCHARSLETGIEIMKSGRNFPTRSAPRRKCRWSQRAAGRRPRSACMMQVAVSDRGRAWPPHRR